MKTITKQTLAALILLSIFLIASCAPQVVVKTVLVTLAPGDPTVIVLEPTITPTIESTATVVSPTPTPTATRPYNLVTITPRATLNDTALYSRYMVLNIPNDGLFIVDSQSGSRRNLLTKKIDPVDVLAFTRQGCGLIAKLRDNSIVELNIKPEVVRELLPPNWHAEDSALLNENISPSGEWMAYEIGTGYDKTAKMYARVDQETVSLVDNSIVRLTKRGAVAGISAWSADSQWLAFSEIENFTNNVYIAHPDGSEMTQVAAIRGADYLTLILKWSADNRKLAIGKLLEDYSIDLSLIDLEQGKGVAQKYPSMPAHLRNFWWDGENNLLLFARDYVTADIMEGSIAWLDSTTGEVIKSLDIANTPEHEVTTAEYLGAYQAAFFSRSRFYTYDALENTLQSHFFNYSILGGFNWMIAPADFPGETACEEP